MTITSAVSESVLARLAALLEAKRLAHAYLFVGPKSIGKKETALAAARLVNCAQATQGHPCDACESCRKIIRGMHPDIHLVADGEGSIKIEDIREMLTQGQLRAFEARFKVFIIVDAERLTLEAGNALLKTLEEPVKDTLIILTTAMADHLLATVRSRCQVINFFGLTKDRLKKYFAADESLSDAQSQFLAYFAEGCPGRIAPEDRREIFRRRNEAVDQFIFAQNEDRYLKSVLADPVRAAEMVRFLFCWFKDLWMLKADLPPGRIINADRLEDLNRQKALHTFEDLEAILFDIVRVKIALDENFNVKIPLVLLKEKIWKR